MNAKTLSMCHGKPGFDRYSLADKSAKHQSREKEHPLMAYHCTHCNKFHVGSVSEHRNQEKAFKIRRQSGFASGE